MQRFIMGFSGGKLEFKMAAVSHTVQKGKRLAEILLN